MWSSEDDFLTFPTFNFYRQSGAAQLQALTSNGGENKRENKDKRIIRIS